MGLQVSADPRIAPATDFIGRKHSLFIDGQWSDATSEALIDVHNPATGALLTQVQAASEADVDQAVRAARVAFDSGPWPRMAPAERALLMNRLADLVESAGEELSILETLDNGMPLRGSQRAVGIAVANLRYFAGWTGKVAGQVHNPTQANTLAYTVREPVGVAALITPWNYPLGMGVAKLAQALAAGCTVVMKPAELTPLSTLRLADLVAEAGFPQGVVNVVPGYGGTAGARLADHPDVDKLSFTGLTATGRSIIRASAGNLKRLTLELGGKSPGILFPDADLAQAIPGAAMAVFANSGQVCVAGSRLFVHRSIMDEVIEGISAFAKSVRVGSGLDPETVIGPLVSEGQFDRVTGYIRSGIDEGADVVQGGKRVGTDGFFMEPAVVTGVRPDMKLVREEIFGPVVVAMPFDDVDDLTSIAEQANDTRYGLAAYLWTQDVSRVHKLAAMLRAGTIHVNGGSHLDPAIPFGGYKESGWGRESGAAGVEAFLETKAVIVKL